MTWRPLPSDEPAPPRPIGDSLDRITKALGGPSAAAVATIFARWEEIVGPAVAVHAKPLSLHRDTLTIGVDQPAWAAQLTYLENDLKRRVNEVAGPETVARVRVTVRPK